MKDKIKIFIIDDHPIVRDGLTQLINQEKDLMACGEAENAHNAVNAIQSLKPDLVIVDISLQGSSSGIELIKDMKQLYPDLYILVLSMHDESFYAERALRAGAKGYVMKQEASEKIIEAIHEILNEKMYISSDIATRMLGKFISNRSSKSLYSSIDLLTNRELEVFRLIGQGHKTSQIANLLCLSVNTIHTHYSNIKRKLKLKNAVELIRHAVQWVDKSTMF